MRCGKSSCNLLIILKKSYLLKNFVHYIKKMLKFHSLYSDCVWYKKLRELACVHYIANFTILQFVITKFVCTNKSQKYHYTNIYHVSHNFNILVSNYCTTRTPTPMNNNLSCIQQKINV